MQTKTPTMSLKKASLMSKSSETGNQKKVLSVEEIKKSLEAKAKLKMQML
jgi:hypothetical protein